MNNITINIITILAICWLLVYLYKILTVEEWDLFDNFETQTIGFIVGLIGLLFVIAVFALPFLLLFSLLEFNNLI